MSRYIDVGKKIEEINKGIESITRLIENRPYDEEAKLILREHKFCLYELERTPIVSEWIDVNDKLPEMYDRVLVNYTYEGGYNKTICAKYIGGKYNWVIEDGKEGWCKITHWMPLPEPPSFKE